jgi:tRNA(Phe) wybutosine-synthesizing methylase Tyw3
VTAVKDRESTEDLLLLPVGAAVTDDSTLTRSSCSGRLVLRV